ncbi:MAG TPA: hypothetical protein VGK47_01470 [Nitrososphaeraceae archaeon]
MTLTYSQLRRDDASKIQKEITSTEDAIIQRINDRMRHKKIIDSNHAYHNPEDDIIYIGETHTNKGYIPLFSTQVKDQGYERRYMEKAKKEYGEDYKKSNDYGKAKIDSYFPEFQEDMKLYLGYLDRINKGEISIKEARLAAAGAMEISDFKGMRYTEIVGSMVDQKVKDFSLPQLGAKYQSGKIFFKIPSLTNLFDAATDLDEHETSEAVKLSFAAKLFRIKKDQVHLSWSDEFEMSGDFDVPIIPEHIRKAAYAFQKARNEKFATLLLSATSEGLSVKWNTYEASTEHFEADPATDIETKLRQFIDTNDGVLNTFVSSAYTYSQYLRNYNVRGAMQPSTNVPARVGIVTNPLGLQDITWYLSRDIPHGTIIGLDDRSVYDIQGIVKTSSYREEHSADNGIYIRDFNGVIYGIDNQVKAITNVL